MKVSILISKTYQEHQYEPLRIELGIERDVSDKIKEEDLSGTFQDFADQLQADIEMIYAERVKNV